MSKEEMLICTKCGEPIKRTQRNCLKCGQLNFENLNNEYMKKYITNNDKQNNVDPKVDKLSIFNNIRPNEVEAKGAGNFIVFIAVNIFIFLLVMLSAVFSSYNGNLTMMFINNEFIFSLIIRAIAFIEFYSMQLLLMKANKPWWAIFIILIVYSIISTILEQINWFVLDLIFSFAMLVIYYNIGIMFGKNPWLMLFFTPIMIPITAFSNTVSYNGIIYVIQTKKGNATELLYKINKIVIFLCFMMILFGICLIVFSNKDKILYKFNESKREEYINDLVVITESAKNSIESDNYTCSNNLPLAEQSSYYIPFDNAATYFNISGIDVSPFTGANYQGYILVMNPSTYYISVDDTMYGVEELSFEYVKSAKVLKNIFSVLPDDVIVCKKN